MSQHTMKKRLYQQPEIYNQTPWVELPIAQLPAGSQEHEDQWSKERDDNFFNFDEQQDVKYGNLW